MVYSDYTNTANARSFHVEIGTYITGLVTPLSTGQKTLLNTFISSLKTGLGITLLSEFFDILYVLAGETSESSLRNIVKNAHHATLGGATVPVFTALEGFKGEGVGYTDTNYNPQTQAVNCVQDNAGLGVYSRTDQAGSVCDMGCARYNSVEQIRIDFRYATNTANARVATNNSGNGSKTGVTSSLGTCMGSRLAADSLRCYINKSGGTVSTTAASTVLPSMNMAIGARNYQLIGFDLITSRQYSFAFASKGLTAANVTTIHDAMEAYMDANGKGVL